ncbi:MAG: DUF2062 domain-containing protein [Planctomycetota bacterium]|nr:DUF2062 domain-containing protein [Planctomycetota bacterium]
MVRRVRINGRRWIRKILSLNDPPESIAASVAIGIFIAWTPTIGLQMIISFALCIVARVNRIAGPLMAWLTNPLTIPPIFYFNYLVGTFIFEDSVDAEVAHQRMDAAWERMGEVGLWDFVTFNRQQIKMWFSELFNLGAEIMIPLLLGSIAVGLVLGVVSYPLTVRAVVAFRKARERRGVFWKVTVSGTRIPVVPGRDEDSAGPPSADPEAGNGSLEKTP